VEQFNAGFYFEAHDTLEEAWSGLRGEARDFFQGLIQISVALYHWRNANPGGALSLFDRGLRRLSAYPAAYEGLDLHALRRDALESRARVAAGEPFPEGSAGALRLRFL
jgi:hypothetical protein